MYAKILANIVLHSRPIVDVQWDPSDYGWKLSRSDTSQTKVLPFFTYSVAFGRNFLLNQIESVPAGKKYWEEGNVSSSHMLWVAVETLRHVFWECVTAKSFWFQILRLLGRKYR